MSVDWDGDVSNLERIIKENKWEEDGICILRKAPFFFFRQTGKYFRVQSSDLLIDCSEGNNY